MIKTLTIGNVELPNRYVLAPMAGVTDLPFRLLCKEQGAGLLCMEMISAKALRYKNKNTKALLAIDPREYPVSLQLFGKIRTSFPSRQSGSKNFHFRSWISIWAVRFQRSCAMEKVRR